MSCRNDLTISSALAHDLRAVIGLEIHAQINSKSKLFSGASSEYGGAPNTQVSYFDAAIPGTLPVLNKYCVEAAVKTALAFGCHVKKVSSFDRKHYFYADMPAGYQITQHRQPIALGGEVEYVIYVRGRHKVASVHKTRLHQIQLEQDSGKSLHDEENSRSLVDLNRAGVALMEIVTEPDFQTGEQAAAFIREIQATLRLINTCDGKMEQGSLRVDANVSVHLPGTPYGTRTEVKNLNSMKAVQQAIDYEITRQKELVSAGGEVINETMSFDSSKRCTIPMRDKERLQDYRFMAEPNLPPLVLSDEMTSNPHILSINKIRAALPELLPVTRRRLVEYGLKLEHAVTVMELGLVSAFDEMLMLLSPQEPTEISRLLFSFLYVNVMMFCGERKCSIDEFLGLVSSSQLCELFMAATENRITAESCKKILHRHLDDQTCSISSMLSSDVYAKITDETEIYKLCEVVANDYPQVLSRYLKKQNSKDFSKLLRAVMTQADCRVEYRDATNVLKLYIDKLTK